MALRLGFLRVLPIPLLVFILPMLLIDEMCDRPYQSARCYYNIGLQSDFTSDLPLDCTQYKEMNLIR